MGFHIAVQEPVRRTESVGVSPDAFRSLIGNSPAHADLLERCTRFVQGGLRDILLTGEPGTGKALLARAIHNASARSGEAFLTVDCSALTPDALEVDLFGRAYGAQENGRLEREGLLQLAGAGTIFIRRIDMLPAEMQPRMLAALRERSARPIGSREAYEIRCAVFSSAGNDFEAAVSNGRFRADLHEFLTRSRETLPPLSERSDDVPELAAHFLSEVSHAEGMPVKLLMPEAVELLMGHRWRGNVRELRRVVRDCFFRSEGDQIEAGDVRLKRVEGGRSTSRRQGTQIHIPPGGKSLEDIEGEAIEAILRGTSGNKSAAARILGISRPTLLRKIGKYGLTV